jgi:hypothetical protein
MLAADQRGKSTRTGLLCVSIRCCAAVRWPSGSGTDADVRQIESVKRTMPEIRPSSTNHFHWRFCRDLRMSMSKTRGLSNQTVGQSTSESTVNQVHAKELRLVDLHMVVHGARKQVPVVGAAYAIQFAADYTRGRSESSLWQGCQSRVPGFCLGSTRKRQTRECRCCCRPRHQLCRTGL